MTKFALRGWRHSAAERVGHELHAVADAQHRTAQIENLGIAKRCAGIRDTLWSSRKDDPGWVPLANVLGRRVRRPDFGIHRQLAQPPSYQLCVLGPKIKDDDRLMVH